MLGPGKPAPKAPKIPSRPSTLWPNLLQKCETLPEPQTPQLRATSLTYHDSVIPDGDEDIGRDAHNESFKGSHPLPRSASDIFPNLAPSTEQFVLYKSYARYSGRPEAPFEAHVRGWLYHPQLNRKGKLMIAAVEKLVGSPGKYSSIADAAAAHVAENQKASQPLIDISDSETPNLSRHTHSSSWLNFARPPVFRSRSSKSVSKVQTSTSESPNSQTNSRVSSALNSQTNSASSSQANSAYDSQVNSSHNSRATSACNSQANSAETSPVNTVPGSPVPETSVIEPLDLNTSPKRPGMRRTATFSFEPPSNPKGKVYSASHWARKEQRNIIRERLAAISHKSLAMRDVQIVVESEPDGTGHIKKRTFWAYTDESGRFGQCCCVSYKPAIVRCMSGSAKESIPLLFVDSHGVSVISDIDDTVKHSGVTKSKRELLQNVFAKSFDDVSLEGVSEWYNHMAEAGASFHYVSNSPWQLYDLIRGYLDYHHFPEGSIHLKKYVGVFDGLTEPAKGRKRATLERIFMDFPDHKFILVGDSGEADLEAYGEIAIRFPDQVLAIYIRDITFSSNEPLNLLEKLTSHRRHSSMDLISLDRISRTLKRDDEEATKKEPPRLPPRIRRGSALHIDSQMANRADSLNMRASTSRSSTPYSSTFRNRDMVMEELNKMSLAENEFKPGSFPPASDTSEHFQNAQSRFSSESPIGSPSSTSINPAESPSDDLDSQVTLTEAISDERPTLPPRPKLLRRTSSKIIEGVYTVATASSHAAARLLGPQLPPRPGTNIKPSPRNLRRYRGSGDEHQCLGGQHDTRRNSWAGTPSSGEFDLEVQQDMPPGFVPSSQDIVDYDKVLADKRSENWRIRVHKQHRAIPKNVRLRMWRHPDDVEAESLRLIKADDESLL